MTTNLPAGYRLRGMGEVVEPSDYVQIWTSFYPVAGSAWEGDVIDNDAKARCIWTADGMPAKPVCVCGVQNCPRHYPGNWISEAR